MSTAQKSSSKPLAPVTAALVALPVLALVVFLGQHGSVVGRLLVGLAAATIVIMGAFMAPVPGASFMAVDGDASFRKQKGAQIVTAAVVAGPCSFIFATPIAVAAGIVAASVAGRLGDGAGAESTGD